MKNLLLSLSIVAFGVLPACAILGASPEEQLRNATRTHTSATNLATALLQRDKITVVQAKNYRAMLGTASDTLNSANTSLVTCRAKTSSTQKTNPDPCQNSVVTDVNLATSILTEVEKVLIEREKQ